MREAASSWRHFSSDLSAAAAAVTRINSAQLVDEARSTLNEQVVRRSWLGYGRSDSSWTVRVYSSDRSCGWAGGNFHDSSAQQWDLWMARLSHVRYTPHRPPSLSRHLLVRRCPSSCWFCTAPSSRLGLHPVYAPNRNRSNTAARHQLTDPSFRIYVGVGGLLVFSVDIRRDRRMDLVQNSIIENGKKLANEVACYLLLRRNSWRAA